MARASIPANAVAGESAPIAPIELNKELPMQNNAALEPNFMSQNTNVALLHHPYSQVPQLHFPSNQSIPPTLHQQLHNQYQDLLTGDLFSAVLQQHEKHERELRQQQQLHNLQRAQLLQRQQQDRAQMFAQRPFISAMPEAMLLGTTSPQQKQQQEIWDEWRHGCGSRSRQLWRESTTWNDGKHH